MTRIKVVIADDNEIVRMGLESLMRSQEDIDLVGTASDGATAVTLFEKHLPDVLIVDMKMPAMDGGQVIRTVLHNHPQARIIVLSHYDNDERVYEALRSGVRGYLTKEIRGTEIINAVRRVYQGESYMPPAILEKYSDRAQQTPLSHREVQVLRGMASGMPNKHIARSLALSTRTVDLYVGRILEKLNASNRTDAVVAAQRRGILEA